MSAREFSVWLNNTYLVQNPDKLWIKDVSSKAVKRSLEDANLAYRRFLMGQAGFPKFKRKNRDEPRVYFVKNSSTECLCERHRIKIPIFGWCKLKEKGYIPTTALGYTISSGSLSCIANRFFITVNVSVPLSNTREELVTSGIGIDLGVKELAICSNGMTFKNINKSVRVRHLNNRLRRGQKSLSRKLQNQKKGKATQGKNIQKQKELLQKTYYELNEIRKAYIRQVVCEIVKTKPSYITIEDLDIRGMLKNKHLAKAVAVQNFGYFRYFLTEQCHKHNIELRVVDRWYPSSKTCNCCGKIKTALRLSDRTFSCSCGYSADRDLNASYNLRDAKIYKIA